MNIKYINDFNNINDSKVVGIYKCGKLTSQICSKLTLQIKNLIDNKNFTADLSNVTRLVDENQHTVIFYGLGKHEQLDADGFNETFESVITFLKTNNYKSVAISLPSDLNRGTFSNLNVLKLASQICTVQLHDLVSYISKTPKNTLENLSLSIENTLVEDSNIAVSEGVAIGIGKNTARDLQTMPANFCTPIFIKEYAEKLSKQYSMDYECLDKNDMEKLNMGCLLAVGNGSKYGSYLVTLSYNGANNKSQAPAVLVGKGVTFDTGGINLKPFAGLPSMKMDMGGSAVVLGTMKAIAEAKLPINVVASIGLVENAIGKDAYRPSDVLTSMSGKTVEVLNTDAEGRLVLCDVLSYVEKFKPKAVLDMATLTGAMLVSLGDYHTGFFTDDSSIQNDLENAATQSNDQVWHLPMTKSYNKYLKSDVADLANIGSNGPSAGSITAALFLANFTKKYRWAHLDIAGSAMGNFGKATATGRPVALLFNYLKNQK